MDIGTSVRNILRERFCVNQVLLARHIFEVKRNEMPRKAPATFVIYKCEQMKETTRSFQKYSMNNRNADEGSPAIPICVFVRLVQDEINEVESNVHHQMHTSFTTAARDMTYLESRVGGRSMLSTTESFGL